MLTRATRRLLLLSIPGVLAAALVLALSWGQNAIPPAAAQPAALPAAADGALPRNIIVMIADGGGFNHYAAAAMYEHGVADSPLYAQFPVRLAMSTFAAGGSYDPQQAATDFTYVTKGATDSAAAATAMATGVKTYPGAIGVDPEKRPVENVLERGEARGRATGVVTAVQISHATPAGFVAHSEGRSAYAAIAAQMINESAVDVIMGAGHPEFDDNGQPVAAERRKYDFVGGEEIWTALRAGTVGGDANGDGTPDPWTLIESVEDFRALAEGATPPRVLGVAQVAQTLQQARDTDPASKDDEKAPAFTIPFITTVPTLAEMTRAALNVLDDDPDGLVLMVEGGAVDWAAHANQAGRVIEEQIDFNRAVEAVVEWVETHGGWEQTLLIVTADHETGYLTGPGSDPQLLPLVSNGAGVQPGMEFHSTGHTNSLVPFYARGAGAESFLALATGSDPLRGSYLDNTDIGRVIFALLP